MMPLTMADVGKETIIKKVGGNTETKKFLERLGFVPGGSVTCANLPMFRLEGTEHMDKAYHQKWFHVKGMLFPGLIFALIPAAIVGVLIYL